MLLDNLEKSFPEGAGYDLLQAEEVAWPGQSQEDLTALKLVLQNVAYAEKFVQTKGYNVEWNHAENLYLAMVPVANWEGTNIPRSHLGVNLVYEHMESILPQVMLGLFADKQPFSLDPRPGTSYDDARANEALLQWELKMCAPQGFREEFRLLAKSALQYGMGIGKWGWRTYTRKRRQWKRKEKPTVIDTGVGTTLSIPNTDEPEFEIVEWKSRSIIRHLKTSTSVTFSLTQVAVLRTSAPLVTSFIGSTSMRSGSISIGITKGGTFHLVKSSAQSSRHQPNRHISAR
jgi:hypothetical protein